MVPKSRTMVPKSRTMVPKSRTMVPLFVLWCLFCLYYVNIFFMHFQPHFWLQIKYFILNLGKTSKHGMHKHVRCSNCHLERDLRYFKVNSVVCNSCVKRGGKTCKSVMNFKLGKRLHSEINKNPSNFSESFENL